MKVEKREGPRLRKRPAVPATAPVVSKVTTKSDQKENKFSKKKVVSKVYKLRSRPAAAAAKPKEVEGKKNSKKKQKENKFRVNNNEGVKKLSVKNTGTTQKMRRGQKKLTTNNVNGGAMRTHNLMNTQQQQPRPRGNNNVSGGKNVGVTKGKSNSHNNSLVTWSYLGHRRKLNK